MSPNIDYRRVLAQRALGQSQRSAARASGYSRKTVKKIWDAADALGLTGEDIAGMENRELKALLFPQSGRRGARVEPDFDAVHSRMAERGMTLSLLYKEYYTDCVKNEVPFYSYAQFCRRYREHTGRYNVTMRILHKPGEEMEVDWAGDHLLVYDPMHLAWKEARVFVSALPCSQMYYAEAFPDMKSESWITGNVHAIHYWGGVPRVIAPDNLKAAVVSHTDSTTFKINQAYQDFADYYHVQIIPTPVRAPRIKASVERAVGIIEQKIMPELRQEKFTTFRELNQALFEKIDVLNHEPFQKREGSRFSCFEAEEKPFLRALPPEPYEVPEWVTRKVSREYMIEAAGCKYTVPYQMAGKKVQVRIRRMSVDVFLGCDLVASHVRQEPGSMPSRKIEHMPPNHAAATKMRDPQTYMRRATENGPATAGVVENFFSGELADKQAFLAASQVLKLADRYTGERLEQACSVALLGTASPEPAFIETILKNNQDKVEQGLEEGACDVSMGITRGAAYYGGKEE